MAKKPVRATPPARPIAMVKPPPSKLPADAVPSLDLAMVLQQLGNDRAYTVISSHGNSWKVHFEGDAWAKTIRVVKGKPEIS